MGFAKMAAPEVLDSDVSSSVTLLKNLQEQVVAVTSQVQALTKKVQAGAYCTEKGLSFLEVKDQLLLMYLMDLSHLILDKASGGSLQGHPAVLRLVEIRTVLEKLRPLDQKLKYQIDKLVKTAVTGNLSENDPLRFKPHPSNMISKLSSEDEEEDEAEEGQSEAPGKKSVKGASKKYIPPRLVPVHYDETEAEREQKRLDRAKKRALSSSVIRELKEQYSDAPEEIRDARHPHVTRQSQEDQHRINYEESMMVRLSVSKREKGRRKRASVMSSQLHSLTHFSDISALTGGTPHLDEDQNPVKKRKKVPKKGRKKRDPLPFISLLQGGSTVFLRPPNTEHHSDFFFPLTPYTQLRTSPWNGARLPGTEHISLERSTSPWNGARLPGMEQLPSGTANARVGILDPFSVVR
ncbi:hypothetical protein STEG23_009848 [Scotinomys teguina]